MPHSSSRRVGGRYTRKSLIGCISTLCGYCCSPHAQAWEGVGRQGEVDIDEGDCGDQPALLPVDHHAIEHEARRDQLAQTVRRNSVGDNGEMLQATADVDARHQRAGYQVVGEAQPLPWPAVDGCGVVLSGVGAPGDSALRLTPAYRYSVDCPCWTAAVRASFASRF